MLNTFYPTIENPVTEKLKPAKIRNYKGDGIFIDRPEIVSNLFWFAQTGNGLVLGGPGIGKSFTMDELRSFCGRKKLPCVVIPVNEHLSGSDQELNDELASSGHWLTALSAEKWKDHSLRAILIFDAFDTAKDETLKSNILKQIKKAIESLHANWSVLVSARTFDAGKSSQLLDLFPDGKGSIPLYCRFFEIPYLTDLDVEKAVRSNAKMHSFMQKATPELKTLLRAPYFLKLAEKIVNQSEGIHPQDLRLIQTESQLLNLYWTRQIANDTLQDLFLRKLTEKLIGNKSLSCSKSLVVTEVNYKICDTLLSLGVLSESSVTKENISYSHNILLEFAFSKYLIPEGVEDIIAHVKAHERLPFLFRQGFVYFYSWMWHVNSPLFWKHYFIIQAQDAPVFRLFHQTILNFVLSGNYEGEQDLKPILEIPNPVDQSFSIKKLLEAIRFVRRDNFLERDLKLFLVLSKKLDERYSWELGYLINKTIEVQKKPLNKISNYILANASIEFADNYLVQRNESSKKHLFDAAAGPWALRNLCAVYPAKKVTATKLIRDFLLMLNEPDFDIRIFYFLVDQISKFAKTDQRFASDVYRAIYMHEELSDAQTSMGNSVVMNLVSNRKQDFQGIHYRMERHFPQLLENIPTTICKLGIEIVDKYSLQRTGAAASKNSAKLSVYGKKAKIISDFSFYDSDHDKEHGPFSHADKIFNFLDALLQNNEAKTADEIIGLIIVNGTAALFWRKLIVLCKRHPGKLKKLGIELLSNVPLLIFAETVFECGELIKALHPHLTKSQKRNLETQILSIRNYRWNKIGADLKNNRILRLLSCIPADSLVLKESIRMVAANGPKENHPVVSKPRILHYDGSEQENMVDFGVDPLNDEERKLYDSLQLYSLFNKTYEKKQGIQTSEYSNLLKNLEDLFDSVLKYPKVSEKLKFNADYELTRFMDIVSQKGVDIDNTSLAILEKISTHFIEAPEHTTASYDKGQMKDGMMAYASLPRTYAVQVICRILYATNSKILAPKVLGLMNDNDQSVRLLSLNTLHFYWSFCRKQFWEKVEERLGNEESGICFGQVINAIIYDDIIEADGEKIKSAIAILSQNLKRHGENVAREIWTVYSVLLLKMVLHGHAVFVRKTASQMKTDEIFRGAIIFEMFKLIDPHALDYKEIAQSYEILFDILLDIISHCCSEIEQAGHPRDQSKGQFRTIDHFIEHLYFALAGTKPVAKGKILDISNKRWFFTRMRPMLSLVIETASRLGSGFMVAHTAYYFTQVLYSLLDIDDEFALTTLSEIVKYAAADGFTYDSYTLTEIVRFAEKVLADHKLLLSEDLNFGKMISVLDFFASSGWQEALELTWRLKDAF
ncbi:MAG TPA: hypothetical protein VK543_13890 [Puia sp.]|nr:hypothetical protein [Puia sp.]